MEIETILKIQDLSKQYRLGEVGTGTISHDLNRWWHKIRGKDDPFLKIGETNDRSSKGTSDYVWALKDINFEVKKGEVLGIIGKNGAGKSTLLKILSKVTAPTTGSIKSKGRIASLLEVGTGFHPELTGRENIYLNGAILGMTKKEISLKIDEIVEFSGCQRYVDTPVKRYSSGMTVRLAFAVAAFLEPEILIIDEVLAVGDAEFQKKALGKMQDISKGEGRTVLFVSHNMAAVETLCTRVISLRNGELLGDGNPSEMIKQYIQSGSFASQKRFFENPDQALGNNSIKVFYAAAENASSQNRDEVIDVSSEIDITFSLINYTDNSLISVGFDFLTVKGDVVFGTGGKFHCEPGELNTISCRIPSKFLNDAFYQIYLYVHNAYMLPLFSDKEIITFEVKDIARESGYLGKINGFIRPDLKWSQRTAQ